MRQTSQGTAGLDNNVEFLVQYGAVDEQPVGQAGGSQQRRERPSYEREYYGWILRWRADPIDWVQECVLAGETRIMGVPAVRCEKKRAR